jgi:predicted neutral ceramidase superfamily lipid hydrolase
MFIRPDAQVKAVVAGVSALPFVVVAGFYLATSWLWRSKLKKAPESEFCWTFCCACVILFQFGIFICKTEDWDLLVALGCVFFFSISAVLVGSWFQSRLISEVLVIPGKIFCLSSCFYLFYFLS